MVVNCDLNLPVNIVKALGLSEDEIACTLKKELAVYFFQRNLLSFGQARQLANISIWDFLSLLKDRKVPLHYDISEYEEDLKTIQELL
ncbi:MAG TPA: UPF0175 family protein [Thermodesulfovibrionia bacterium]|nr:UPF0175 family protein [Thermodesulfovibrionia bacterium]